MGGDGGLSGFPGDAGAAGAGLGGAIFNLSGTVTLDSATIASNTADTGGALYNLGYLAADPPNVYAAQATMVNSILADSVASADVCVLKRSLPLEM